MSSIAANLHVDKVYSALWSLSEPVLLPSAQAIQINTASNQWRLISVTDNQNAQELMSQDGILVAPEQGLYALYLQTVVQSQSNQDFPGGGGDVEHWCVVSHKDANSPRLGLQMGGRCSTLSSSGAEQFFLPALSAMVPLSLYKGSTITLYAFQKTGKSLSIHGEAETYMGSSSVSTTSSVLPKVGTILGFHMINRHSPL